MSRQQVFKAVRQELVYRWYRGISRKRRIKKFQFHLEFSYSPPKKLWTVPMGGRNSGNTWLGFGWSGFGGRMKHFLSSSHYNINTTFVAWD